MALFMLEISAVTTTIVRTLPHPLSTFEIGFLSGLIKKHEGLLVELDKFVRRLISDLG